MRVEQSQFEQFTPTQFPLSSTTTKKKNTAKAKNMNLDRLSDGLLDVTANLVDLVDASNSLEKSSVLIHLKRFEETQLMLFN